MVVVRYGVSTVSSWGGGGEVWGVYCEFMGWWW